MEWGCSRDGPVQEDLCVEHRGQCPKIRFLVEAGGAWELRSYPPNDNINNGEPVGATNRVSQPHHIHYSVHFVV